MAQEKVLKNFISVVLGIALRKVRESEDLSLDEMAQRTNLKASSLQAYEKANAIFRPAKAYELYKGYEKHFSFDGLTIMLNLISIVETYANEQVEANKAESDISIEKRNAIYGQGQLESCKQITLIDSKYKKLLSPFFDEQLFVGKSIDEVTRTIEYKNMVVPFMQFLRDPYGFGENVLSGQVNKQYFEIIGNVPSSYGSLIPNAFEFIKYMPTTITLYDFVVWLELNKDNIEGGFMMSREFTRSLIKGQAPGLFSFLWGKHFHDFTIMYGNTVSATDKKLSVKSKVEEQTIKEYITTDILENNDYKKPKDYSIEAGLDKLLVIGGTFKEVVGKRLGDKGDIFWIFHLRDSQIAGFLGFIHDVPGKGKVIDRITILTFKQLAEMGTDAPA